MVIINFVDTNTQEVEGNRDHVGEKTNPFLPNTLERSVQTVHPRGTIALSCQGR